MRNCREGMTVVATRRNDEKVKETVREINKLGTIHHPSSQVREIHMEIFKRLSRQMYWTGM